MNGSVGQNLGDDAVLLAAVHGRGVEPLGLEHGGHDAWLHHHRVAEGDGDNVGISELNCLSSTSIMAPELALYELSRHTSIFSNDLGSHLLNIAEGF